jgi:hypothetical protein
MMGTYRDEPTMITWYDGAPTTDEEESKMVQPNAAQIAARDEVAAEIHDRLDRLDGLKRRSHRVVRLEDPRESRGPLGGLSSRIAVWLEDDDGTLHAVVVNVYCDDNVRASLVADIEAQRAEQEENDRIRSVVLGQ